MSFARNNGYKVKVSDALVFLAVCSGIDALHIELGQMVPGDAGQTQGYNNPNPTLTLAYTQPPKGVGKALKDGSLALDDVVEINMVTAAKPKGTLVAGLIDAAEKRGWGKEAFCSVLLSGFGDSNCDGMLSKQMFSADVALNTAIKAEVEKAETAAEAVLAKL